MPSWLAVTTRAAAPRVVKFGRAQGCWRAASWDVVGAHAGSATLRLSLPFSTRFLVLVIGRSPLSGCTRGAMPLGALSLSPERGELRALCHRARSTETRSPTVAHMNEDVNGMGTDPARRVDVLRQSISGTPSSGGRRHISPSGRSIHHRGSRELPTSDTSVTAKTY